MTGRFWICTLIGLAVLLPCAGAGWHLARYRSTTPVRLIAWWVADIAIPLIRSPSWIRRASTIFLNNSAVLAMVMGLGRWQMGGYAAVAALGVSMGTGLRILSDVADRFPLPGSRGSPKVRRLMAIGIALNMLELPAIAAVLGLAIGQPSIPVTPDRAWTLYFLYIVPALLVAACGESLWLGAGRSQGTAPTEWSEEPLRR